MKNYKYKGLSYSTEYKSWAAMNRRCYNQKDNMYRYYGGRGITVCDRWRYNFLNFLEDMGKKPFKGAQIDREENNGNYNLSNCRWVPPYVNVRNRSITKLNKNKVERIRFLYSNHIFNQKQIAEIFSVDPSNISYIVRYKRWFK